MKIKQAHLSPLEWEIMDVIWDQNRQISVREVLEIKYPEGEKAYTTVQTVMNKLEKKGYLTIKKMGLVNFYLPAHKRTNALQSETTRFVKRVYNGSFLSLANYLINSESLSHDEIENLKKLIEEKEQDKRKAR